MDLALSVWFSSWSWRPEILATLGLAAALHLFGQRRLRKRGAHRLAKSWRAIAYLSGLIVVAVALMSPIDVLSGRLFFMHMIQHLLLVMIAPPLLLIANPFPFALWGLPAGLRREVARLFAPGSTFRRGLRSATAPGLVWMYFVAALVGWHDPGAYGAALESDLIHDLEHLTFFATAMLFWWHVIGAGPRVHGQLSPGLRVGYALSAVPPNMITGVVIAFTSEPLYPHYTAVTRLWGMGVMDDQMLGGVIMWVPGSMMYIVAALVLIARMLREEDEKPVTESEWATDEAMIAPRMER